MPLRQIWMSASLGLTAIVGEATKLDHERVIHLRWGPWLASKWALLSGLSVVQALLLWGWLLLLLGPNSAGLDERRDVVQSGLAAMIVLAWAAVGLGLLISALAKVAGSIHVAH